MLSWVCSKRCDSLLEWRTTRGYLFSSDLRETEGLVILVLTLRM